MGSFVRDLKWMGVFVAAVILSLGAPGRVLGDDAAKTDSKIDSRATEKKPDAPAALTERERMLLDRVEQLERRVEELESKNAAPKKPDDKASEAAEVAPSPAASGSATKLPEPAASERVANPVEAIPVSAVGVATQAATKPAPAEPFAFADWTWLNGNARTKDSPMDTKFFTPEIRADVDYVYDFNHPKDDTIGGSSEVFRSNELQVTQLGVGGDFHYDNVRARVMTQFGLYSQTTPRNDASPSRGQWNLDDAYRYLSEAYGGYHFNALHGINVDAGIFMSYVGLFSYYNFDNWAYQPSYVSSNTPWFFNGVRVQIFPTEHLKIEPWFINGWQSYGRFNGRPGFGFQILWRPSGMVFGAGESIFAGRRCAEYAGSRTLSHRRQHRDQVLRQA